LDDNVSFILEFLKPYVKAMVSSGDYQAFLYHSNLYIMVDNAALFKMDLSTKVDPNICLSFDRSQNTNMNNISVYTKYCEISPNLHTNNMVYEDPAIMEDPKFENCVNNLKTSDGAQWYFINTSLCTIFIPLFLGFPNVKKQDNVEIRVHYLGNNMFMIHYTVFKKKFGTSYDLYYQIINVNSPLR